jgi:transcriptional regulator of acetoin/glycerol metabolism
MANDANAVALVSDVGKTRTLAEIEEEAIQKAISRHHGNMSTVAARLGISRSTLYRKLGPKS